MSESWLSRLNTCTKRDSPAVNGTAPAFPDANNTAYADFNNNFLVPKMIQRVVIDNYDPDRAMDEAQKAGDAIYAKYK